MPEGRMLKKEICKSRKMGELPTDSSRLLYVLMLPYLDIEGRLEADLYLIKGRIVPRLKNWDLQKVERCLFELVKHKMIWLYQVDGDQYLQYIKFKSHQKINPAREAPSKIPKPPKKNDTNIKENQKDDSITHDLLLQTREELRASKVKLSKVNKSKGKEILFEKTSNVNGVFSYWQKIMKTPLSKLTIGRKKIIEARLKEGYSVDNIKRGIDGCAGSKYHMGENDQNTVYNDLTLICRSGEKLEWFMRKTETLPTDEPPKYDRSKLDFSALEE